MMQSMQTQKYKGQLHRRLLATVSATALLACAATARQVHAADSDHAMVWIEMGGAFDKMTADDTRWLPPNMTPALTNPPPGPFGSLPTTGYDADLKISLTPNNFDWIFSAAIRYGRALSGPKRSHDQSYDYTIHTAQGVPIKYYLTNWDFANTAQRSKSSHMMLDFQASRDVGLGLFGGKSQLGFGVRVAKLNESANGHLTAFVSAPAKYSPGETAHKADFLAKHSFSGIGPQVTWDASTSFAGNLTEGFSFDWGATAALLFGRQKANVSLHTKDERYVSVYAYKLGNKDILSQSTENPRRSHNAMVPNLGGFAALSWRLPNAKVSIGYKADFFFNAIDGGIDARKNENRGFYGPYASISIGIP
jgi:hypothetical protein